MARSGRKHAVDPDEIDLYDTLKDASRASEALLNLFHLGVLDLDNLDVYYADPLVLEVEAFVTAYRKQYGKSVR